MPALASDQRRWRGGAALFSDSRFTISNATQLENGRVFDSTYARQKPFTFKLGAGAVVPGWEEAVKQVSEDRLGGRHIFDARVVRGADSSSACLTVRHLPLHSCA